jgi:hypothetical protein
VESINVKFDETTKREIKEEGNSSMEQVHEEEVAEEEDEEEQPQEEQEQQDFKVPQKTPRR